jgi:hypothetical protein
LPSISNNIRGGAALTDAGASVVLVSAQDDSSDVYNLPFPITYLGSTYNSLYVGTNGYVTFGGGSSVYTTTTYDNPSLPKIMISVCDLTNHRRYIVTEGSAPDRTWTLRWEGRIYPDLGANWIGNYNIAWEMTFYENPNNQIDLSIEVNAKY